MWVIKFPTIKNNISSPETHRNMELGWYVLGARVWIRNWIINQIGIN